MKEYTLRATQGKEDRAITVYLKEKDGKIELGKFEYNEVGCPQEGEKINSNVLENLPESVTRLMESLIETLEKNPLSNSLEGTVEDGEE